MILIITGIEIALPVLSIAVVAVAARRLCRVSLREMLLHRLFQVLGKTARWLSPDTLSCDRSVANIPLENSGWRPHAYLTHQNPLTTPRLIGDQNSSAETVEIKKLPLAGHDNHTRLVIASGRDGGQTSSCSQEGHLS